MLKEKYDAVLRYIEEHAEAERIWEEAGTLKVRAVVDTPLDRDMIEREIAALSSDTPADLSVYLRVRETPRQNV